MESRILGMRRKEGKAMGELKSGWQIKGTRGDHQVAVRGALGLQSALSDRPTGTTA